MKDEKRIPMLSRLGNKILLAMLGMMILVTFAVGLVTVNAVRSV